MAIFDPNYIVVEKGPITTTCVLSPLTTHSVMSVIKTVGERVSQSESRSDTLRQSLKQAEELVAIDTSEVLKPSHRLQR